MSRSNGKPDADLSKLLRLVRKEDLFRDQHGRAFGTLQSRDQIETFQLDDDGFRMCLSGIFYERFKRVPSRSTLDKAINQIMAWGQSAPVTKVFVRVGYGADNIVLDLGRNDGQVVDIRRGGWKLRREPRARFRRPKGMMPLPIPVDEECNLRQELARIMRVTDPITQVLLTAYVVGALNPQIPLPVLEIIGPQGSAKSTRTKSLREIIDPNATPVRTIPSNERDLFISAYNSWLLCLDNTSRIPSWFSDAVCSIATGGGYTTRKLYKDEDETLFDVRRPVVFNSIHEVIARPDLRDRALTVLFPQIPDEERITEKEYWREFHEAHPRILAAILDCVAMALLWQPRIKIESLPRMADWYLWVLTATKEPAMGVSAEEFEQAFKYSRELSRELAIDASPIGRPLLQLVGDKGGWIGTCAELLEELTTLVRANPQYRRDWPTSPESLGHMLKRIEPDLEFEGLSITYKRSKSKTRERLIILRLRR